MIAAALRHHADNNVAALPGTLCPSAIGWDLAFKLTPGVATGL
jgi:hypothetical protein